MSVVIRKDGSQRFEVEYGRARISMQTIFSQRLFRLPPSVTITPSPRCMVKPETPPRTHQPSSRGKFQDRRSSNNSSIIDSLSAVAQNKITLSSNTLRRNLNAEVDSISGLGEVSEDRSSGGNERRVELRSPGARRQGRGRLDLHCLASSDGACGSRGDGWIGFHGQGWVGGRAGLDEGGRESIDRVRSERNVIRRREWAQLLRREVSRKYAEWRDSTVRIEPAAVR